MKRLFSIIALLAACSGDDGTSEPTVPGAIRFSDLDAGYYHSCGLGVDRRIYCWGTNDFGTLGDGTRVTRTTPTEVAGGLAYTTLDAGAGHNCALTAGGVAQCWGQNDEGQVGDGGFGLRTQPVAVAGNHAFVAISAGHAHSCGLLANGSAYCWGDNTRGQLGAGVESPTKSATPLRVLGAPPLASISAGYYQTCGLTAAGEAYCWGLNSSGQNGDGTTTDAFTAVRARTGQTFTAIAPGDRFVCGISNNRTVCWGQDRHGERRDGEAASFVATSAGESTIPGVDSYACGVRPDGSAICWGGTIRALRASAAAPQLLHETLRFQILAAGSQHVCGLSRGGYAYCGGANYAAQLGDGTHTDRAALVPVKGRM